MAKKSSADRAAEELTAQMEEAKTTVEDEQTVAELRGKLSDQRRRGNKYGAGISVPSALSEQLEYNQNSPIMQMNPSAVYSGELEYYISAGYDTGMIALLYQNILNSMASWRN